MISLVASTCWDINQSHADAFVDQGVVSQHTPLSFATEHADVWPCNKTEIQKRDFGCTVSPGVLFDHKQHTRQTMGSSNQVHLHFQQRPQCSDLTCTCSMVWLCASIYHALQILARTSHVAIFDINAFRIAFESVRPQSPVVTCLT